MHTLGTREVKEGVAVTKKSVLPISGRKLGEFCRLLEERGVGDRIFQLLIEDPNRLVDFIFGEYCRRFPPKVRRALLHAGYEIVQVPGILTAPVTLNQLFLARESFGVKFWTDWHGDFTCGDIGYFPLPAGEIAWMPEDPLIPESTGKTFAEQEEVVVDFSQQVQKRVGDEVEAVFPTAEQAVLVLFDYRRRTREYVFGPWHTWTLNRSESGRLSVSYFDDLGLLVDGWRPEDGSARNLGVFRLVRIVPRS